MDQISESDGYTSGIYVRCSVPQRERWRDAAKQSIARGEVAEWSEWVRSALDAAAEAEEEAMKP